MRPLRHTYRECHRGPKYSFSDSTYALSRALAGYFVVHTRGDVSLCRIIMYLLFSLGHFPFVQANIRHPHKLRPNFSRALEDVIKQVYHGQCTPCHWVPRTMIEVIFAWPEPTPVIISLLRTRWKRSEKPYLQLQLTKIQEPFFPKYCSSYSTEFDILLPHCPHGCSERRHRTAHHAQWESIMKDLGSDVCSPFFADSQSRFPRIFHCSWL